MLLDDLIISVSEKLSNGSYCEEQQQEQREILNYLIELQHYKLKDIYAPKNNHKLFLVWQTMKSRCYNSNTDNFKSYGARGIKVCSEWRNSSMTFIKWAVEHGYKKGLQLDRIDVNGDYEPNNCQWITPKENSRNKTNTSYLNINGETKSIAELCEKYNIPKTNKVYKWVKRNGKQEAEKRFLKLIESL